LEEEENNISIQNIDQELSWIDSEISLLRIQGSQGEKFYRIFHNNNVTFEISGYINRIYFEIIDLREIPECTVYCRFNYRNGGIQEKQIDINNGEYYKNSVPVRIDVEESGYIKSFDIEIEYTQSRLDTDIHSAEDEEWSTKDFGPVISLPEVYTVEETNLPDIFLITVDTFRQDYTDRLQNTINSLGDNVKIPDSPQTQGVCTWPSHASIFTGVHPGTHKSHAKSASIFDQSLDTIPEILEEKGYICSACVGKMVVSPQYGFGKGFHRFELNPMSWQSRQSDAETNVQQIKKWLKKDKELSNPNFYFMHLFDAHYPYYPPLPQNTLNQIDFNLRERIPHPGDYRDYIDLIENDPIEISETDLSLIKEYYSLSLDYVDHQLANLISAIESTGDLENSFIIIAGDHGEDLYERNFMYHHSLYQPNISPGLIVKPPENEGVKVPDKADLIDIFPTIHDLSKEEKQVQSEGQSWMTERKLEPRITERFVDCYNVSVTDKEMKAIYTFEKNKHERPTEAQLQSGPILEEYFSVTDGIVYEDCQPSEDVKSEMKKKAYEFISKSESNSGYNEVDLSKDAEKRLEKLGYKQ
jgi:hypothetical protein